MLVVFLALLASSVSIFGSLTDFTCMVEADPSPGVSLPRGDLYMKVGDDPIDLSCHLNPTHSYFLSGLNSSQLTFAGISPVYVSSNTSISAKFNPDVPGVTDATCYLNPTRDSTKRLGICPKTIFTGYNPLPVDNFSCISENWQSLNCTWTEPYNPIPTNYDLDFKVKGFGNSFHDCPRKKGVKEPSCYLTLSSVPHPYRQGYDKYYFFFNASNALQPFGVVSKITQDHYLVVRPGPARSLLLSSKSPSSLQVNWTIPLELIHFPPGLVHQVSYMSEWEDKWHVADTSSLDLHIESLSLDLTDLVYPYSQYKVEVKMKSGISGSYLWSTPDIAKGRTMARSPSRPPTTHMASFELAGSRIFVYWQTLRSKEFNGPDFRYTVTDVKENGNSLAILPKEIKESYVTFTGLDFGKSYNFSISSRNKVGFSTYASSVYVPPLKTIFGHLPRAVTKIYREEGMFDLVWQPPKDPEVQIESYTLFWCEDLQGKDRPYQCDGFLEWKTIEVDLLGGNLSHSLLMPKISAVYQLGVAANMKSGVSSGLQWSLCTILGGKVVETKLTGVDVDKITSDRVRLTWNMDCNEGSGVVERFVVEYCQANEGGTTCEGEILRTRINWSGSNKADIADLTPYTHYMFRVGIESRVVDGVQSDPVTERTLASAPGSPPINLSVHNITHNSAKLVWDPPEIPNGPISIYEVKLIGSPNNELILKKSKTTNINVNNLVSYSPYHVTVRACTSNIIKEDNIIKKENMCSQQWTSIELHTIIGTPGIPKSPGVTFINTTAVDISWSSDFQVGAPKVEKWEVRIRRVNSSDEGDFLVDYVNSDHPDGVQLDLNEVFLQSSLSEQCEENSPVNTYSFSVRALVVNMSGQQFVGPWSEVTTQPAYCQQSLPWVVIILVVTLVPVFALLLVTVLCRSYSWYSRKKKLFNAMAMELDKIAIPPLSGQVDPEYEMQQPKLTGKDHSTERPVGGPVRQESVASSSQDSGVSGVRGTQRPNSNQSVMGSGYISMVSCSTPESPVNLMPNISQLQLISTTTPVHPTTSPVHTSTPSYGLQSASFLTPQRQGYCRVGVHPDTESEGGSATPSPATSAYVPLTSIRPLEGRPGPPGYISLGNVVRPPIRELVLQPTNSSSSYSRLGERDHQSIGNIREGGQSRSDENGSNNSKINEEQIYQLAKRMDHEIGPSNGSYSSYV